MKLPNGYGSVSKLGGKRRKPFIVRKTLGYHINEETGKVAPDTITIGYTKTRAEGYQLLAEYNSSPYDLAASKMTFAQVYEEWSSKKFPTISQSGINGYIASYKSCEKLYDRVFKDLKLADLQMVIDECDKNYPTLKKIKVLFNQLYKFAIKNDICNKDYSSFVDIAQYKDRNPNKYDREKFTKDEIAKIWEMKDDKYYQIILMLLYNGLRISEFLSLKKENVHLDEQYFDVIDSKTENGIRKVPIADKMLPFYQSWYDSCPECEYLLHNEKGKGFKYDNYYRVYWTPLMEQLGIERTPHCTRHTTISMLSEAKVQETTIKKIIGHSGAMTLTEKVYTHLDMSILIDAINKTLEDIPIENETPKKTA